MAYFNIIIEFEKQLKSKSQNLLKNISCVAKKYFYKREKEFFNR